MGIGDEVIVSHLMESGHLFVLEVCANVGVECVIDSQVS